MSHWFPLGSRFFIVSAIALSVALCDLENSVAIGAPPTLSQLFELQSPNTQYGDSYGWSVAIQGSYTAVGMTNGRDKVFVYDTYTGQLLRTLSPNNATGDIGFGHSLAIDGNLLVVDARYDDVQAPGGTLYNTGAAYVYDLNTGQEITRLVPNDVASYMYLDAVAVDGTNVLVGGGNARAAYLFDAMSGQQLAKFTPSVPTTVYGDALAIDGKTAVVGSGHQTETGALYVYDIDTKTETRRIVPQDAAIGDGFGTSVDLDGENVIVGSPLHDASYANSGAAYVFDVVTGQQLAMLLPPVASGTANAPAFFGGSVAIDGNLSVVGAPQFKREGVRTGGAFMFDWPSSTATYDLVPNDAASRSQFGQSVDMNGNFVAAGAFESNNRQLGGAAYVFGIPEPSTLILLAIGAISLLGHRKAKSYC